MNHSTPGLSVHHQLLESTQTHVHWVSDALQPSHPLSSPSPPALNLSQHQGLFKWVSSPHQVTKVLGVSASTSVPPMNTQDWSPLGWTGWISLQSKGLWIRVFSNIIVQKHQFFGTQLSLQYHSQGFFAGGSKVKASACNSGDPGSIPGLGRSLGEGNGNPLQYSCLENPMEGGGWWATVHGVTLTFTLHTCSVQFCSVVQSCLTLCKPMNCSMPGLPVHHQLPEFTQTHVHRCHPAISSCHPLLLLPPIPPRFRVLSNESTLRMRWPKYWSFSFSISPSNEHSRLISFRMDWLDLLAVQGTLKSLLQHHSSKASIFRHSAFFTVHTCYILANLEKFHKNL